MALRTQLETKTVGGWNAWRPDKWIGMHYATWDDKWLNAGGAERQDICWQRDTSRMHWIDPELTTAELVDAFPDAHQGNVWWVWGRLPVRKIPASRSDIRTVTWTDWILGTCEECEGEGCGHCDEGEVPVEREYEVGLTLPAWIRLASFWWMAQVTAFAVGTGGWATFTMAHTHLLRVGMRVLVYRAQPSKTGGRWSNQPTIVPTGGNDPDRYCHYAKVTAVEGLQVQVQFTATGTNAGWRTTYTVNAERSLDPDDWLTNYTYLGDLCYLRCLLDESPSSLEATGTPEVIQYGEVTAKPAGATIVEFPGGHHFQVGNNVWWVAATGHYVTRVESRATVTEIGETTIRLEDATKNLPSIGTTAQWTLAGPWYSVNEGGSDGALAPGRKSLMFPRPDPLEVSTGPDWEPNTAWYGLGFTGSQVPYSALLTTALTMRVDTSVCVGYGPSWQVQDPDFGATTWARSTEYEVGQVVIPHWLCYEPEYWYICQEEHTSGADYSDFAVDRDAGKWTVEAWQVGYGGIVYYQRTGHYYSIHDFDGKHLSEVGWHGPHNTPIAALQSSLEGGVDYWTYLNNVWGASIFESGYFANTVNLRTLPKSAWGYGQGTYLSGTLPNRVTVLRRSGLPFNIYQAELRPYTWSTDFNPPYILTTYLGTIVNPYTGGTVYQFQVPGNLKASSFLHPADGSLWAMRVEMGHFDEDGECKIDWAQNFDVQTWQPQTAYGLLLSVEEPEEGEPITAGAIEVLRQGSYKELDDELVLNAMSLRWATGYIPRGITGYWREGCSGTWNSITAFGGELTTTGGTGQSLPTPGFWALGAGTYVSVSAGILTLPEGHPFGTHDGATGTLATRISDDEGTITLDGDHPFVLTEECEECEGEGCGDCDEGQVPREYPHVFTGIVLRWIHNTIPRWRTGVRGEVTDDTMTISGGSGTDLPAAETEVVVATGRYTSLFFYQAYSTTGLLSNRNGVVVGNTLYIDGRTNNATTYRVWRNEPTRISIFPRRIQRHKDVQYDADGLFQLAEGGVLNLEYRGTGAPPAPPTEAPDWCILGHFGVQQSCEFLDYLYNRGYKAPGGASFCDVAYAYAWTITVTGTHAANGEYTSGQADPDTGSNATWWYDNRKYTNDSPGVLLSVAPVRVYVTLSMDDLLEEEWEWSEGEECDDCTIATAEPIDELTIERWSVPFTRYNVTSTGDFEGLVLSTEHHLVRGTVVYRINYFWDHATEVGGPGTEGVMTPCHGQPIPGATSSVTHYRWNWNGDGDPWAAQEWAIDVDYVVDDLVYKGTGWFKCLQDHKATLANAPDAPWGGGVAFWENVTNQWQQASQVGSIRWTDTDGSYVVISGEIPAKDWWRARPDPPHTDTDKCSTITVKSNLGLLLPTITATLNAIDHQPA